MLYLATRVLLLMATNLELYMNVHSNSVYTHLKHKMKEEDEDEDQEVEAFKYPNIQTMID